LFHQGQRTEDSFLSPIYLPFSNMVIDCLRKYIKQGDRQ